MKRDSETKKQGTPEEVKGKVRSKQDMFDRSEDTFEVIPTPPDAPIQW